MKEKRQKIDAEIVDAQNEIRTDKLDISFGEIANLYENNELICLGIDFIFKTAHRWFEFRKEEGYS